MDLSAATWRKSSRSGSQSNCVEVARVDRCTGVRNSKNPEGGHLIVADKDWQSFLASVKGGQLDL
ncbi:MAG: DUF397 domain-containing protein [Sciscionella sp.]